MLAINGLVETGKMRPYAVLSYNAVSIVWLERLDVSLQPGDWLTIVQNVSGG